MNKLMLPVFAILATAATVSGQPNLSRQYTRPAVPTQEALNRLNLKLAWRSYLPVDGRRDGVLTAQVLGDQVLIQLRSGALLAINAETGKTEWHYRLDTPYRVSNEVGLNAKLLFAMSGTRVVVLDRTTGKLQWEYDLGTVPSAPPVASSEFLYVCLVGGRVVSYMLPKPDKSGMGGQENKREATPAERQQAGPAYDKLSSRGQTTESVGPLAAPRMYRASVATGPQPSLWWNYGSGRHLDQRPLLTTEAVVLAASDGTFFALATETGKVLYEFQAASSIAAPPGQHGETAYLVSQDNNLYAANLVLGHVLWRFGATSPITLPPRVTDADIYLVPSLGGLYRIDRESGREIWRNHDAHRFRAVNPKFVYATDRAGRLMVLDRARGTRLGGYDTSEFVVPISNEVTDRLFLAANDGLLICLHDHAYAKPFWNRKPEGKKPEKKPEVKPPADQDEAKPAEKPKDGNSDKKDGDKKDDADKDN